MKPRRTKLDISLPKEAGRGREAGREDAVEATRGRAGEGRARRRAAEVRQAGRWAAENRFGIWRATEQTVWSEAGFWGEAGSLAVGARAVRKKRASDRGLISGRVGRREQVQVLVRDRAGRLERSPVLGRSRVLAAERDGGGRAAAERSSERPRFDKRAGGPPRAGSGFGARPSRPFGAKPAFGARPGFGGGRDGGAGRSGERSEVRGGERKERKPRGPEFGGKPREGAAGRYDGAARKPFRPQGERPFSKPGEGAAKRFDSGRDSGRRTGSKARWVPRPNSARSEEGRGPAGGGDRPAAGFEKKRWEVRPETAAGAERAKPAFGARPAQRERGPLLARDPLAVLGQTRGERDLHLGRDQAAVRGPVVSRGLISRVSLQSPAGFRDRVDFRGPAAHPDRVDFQKLASPAAAVAEVVRGLAESGRAAGKSQNSRVWN